MGILLIGVLIAGCQTRPGASVDGSPSPGASEPATSASTTASESAVPSDGLAPFTCTLPIRGAATGQRAQITDLAVGTDAEYDRIVFDFAAGLPQYTVDRAVPPLVQDASGMSIDVSGSSFLKVTLNGGTVMLPDGGASYSGPRDFKPGYPALIELRSAGDFEAVATWYVGLSSEACVRVFTLQAPSRLVIDVRH